MAMHPTTKPPDEQGRTRTYMREVHGGVLCLDDAEWPPPVARVAADALPHQLVRHPGRALEHVEGVQRGLQRAPQRAHHQQVQRALHPRRLRLEGVALLHAQRRQLRVHEARVLVRRAAPHFKGLVVQRLGVAHEVHHLGAVQRPRLDPGPVPRHLLVYRGLLLGREPVPDQALLSAAFAPGATVGVAVAAAAIDVGVVAVLGPDAKLPWR